MSVRVVVKPPVIITKDDAKKHLNVDFVDDDEYIEALVTAAVFWLDGPAGWLGRALGEQTLEATASGFDCWPYGLPCPPVINLVSCDYVDRSGNTQALATSAIRVLTDGRIEPAFGKVWPAVGSGLDKVSILYKAGYPVADGKSTVPPPIRVAILMLVAQWYATREPISIGSAVSELPFAVHALLQPFRLYQ